MASPIQGRGACERRALKVAAVYTVPQVLGRTAWLLTAVPTWYLAIVPAWYFMCVPIIALWRGVCWTVNAVMFVIAIGSCVLACSIALSLVGGFLGSIKWPKTNDRNNHQTELMIVDERPGGWIQLQEVRVPAFNAESEPSGPYW